LRDKLIPVETGELFKQKIEAVGGRCDLHWYKDQSHGFFNKMYTETMTQVDAFLVSLGYLKGPATLAQGEEVAPKEHLDSQLIVAVKKDNIAKVTELLDQGANVNAVDKAKSNALICAVVIKNLEMVKLLVEFGADIKQKNKHNVNALDVARNRKLTDIEEFLKSK